MTTFHFRAARYLFDRESVKELKSFEAGAPEKRLADAFAPVKADLA